MAGALCDAAVVRHARETVECLGLTGHEDWHYGVAKGVDGFYRWPGPATKVRVTPLPKVDLMRPRESSDGKVSTERV